MLGSGHRNGAALVRNVVELRGKPVLLSVHDVAAGSVRMTRVFRRLLRIRIAALDHEARNDSMEECPVVEAAGGEIHEVLYMLRCFVVVELDADVADISLDRGQGVGI